MSSPTTAKTDIKAAGPASDSQPTLIIYGATSYTARQLLVYLENHKDGDRFNFILAGRNAGRLESVNARLKKTREVVVCDLGDESAVRSMMQKGDVVVNLAGPFKRHNAEALIKECVRTGKHYLDLTGESGWLANDIIPRYHEKAAESGSVIIPASGFDSVPSDITVYLALKTLQATYGPKAQIADSTSFFKLKGGSVSGGTVQSMYAIAEAPKDERRSGEFDLVPRAKSGSSPSRKSATPQLSYSLSIPSQATKYGFFFFMYPFNRCIVRRSIYLSTLSSPASSSSSSSTGASGANDVEPVHGEGMKYAEAVDGGKGRFGSGLISAAMFFAFGLFFSSSLVRKFASRFLPKAGEGVSVEELHAASYRITNLSTSAPLPNGQAVQVVTTFDAKGDPGYLSTAYILAESALSLLLPPPSGRSLPPLGQQGGVLTASTALGSILVDRLNDSGEFKFDTRIVSPSSSCSREGESESRKNI